MSDRAAKVVVRRVAWFLAGLALGAALSLGARRLLSPLRWLPDDEIHAYVAAGCRGSQQLADALSQPDLVRRAWVVPLVGHADPFGRELCEKLRPRLRERQPLLALVPADLACDWLAADATDAFGHQGYYPVLVRGGEVIERAEAPAVFAAAGMSYAPTRDGWNIAALP